VQYDLQAKLLIGPLVALVIVVLWISSLGFLLGKTIAEPTALWILPVILGRTFIQTGLFIIAHDAIHGAVIPGDRRLNHWIGRLAVTLYALLSYQRLSLNHWKHHQHPGQVNDPDFHDGTHQNIIAWYLKFMKGYITVSQRITLFFGIGSIFLALHLWFCASIANLVLFWVLPILLSSMQLFLFGTYLPHRSRSVGSVESDNANNIHHITSSNYPLIWSFLSCYHFGYHWEHHEYPWYPWYSLPSVRHDKLRRQSLKIDSSKTLVFHPIAPSLQSTLLLLPT
jgi:beta-carotene ketolase (CrtW type)